MQDAQAQSIAYAVADGTGFYQLPTVPTGQHMLTVSPPFGQGTYLQPAPLTVATTWGHTTVTNVELVQASTIRGRSADAESNAPLAGACAQLYQVGGDRAGSRCVGEDGVFEITGLAAGIYRMHIFGAGDAYRDQWFDSADTEDTATVITLESSTTRHLGTFRLAKRSDSGSGGYDEGSGSNTGGNPGGDPGGAPDPPANSQPIVGEPITTQVAAGGSVSSAPKGTAPSASNPIIASVTSPVAGQVSFKPATGPATAKARMRQVRRTRFWPDPSSYPRRTPRRRTHSRCRSRSQRKACRRAAAPPTSCS